jgi:hypothetical protein
MSFTQFCSNFEEKLDLKGAKAALDYVFGTERGNLDSYRPSRSDTKGFIRVLKTAILAEAKELSVERAAALDEILGYNENPGVSKFEGIDPPLFAFQLSLRVREPSLLDQRYTGVCGASSLVTFFAKRMPAAFADYAISLMRSGEGKVYGRSVKATCWALWGTHSKKMAAADIVVLGTVGFDWLGTTFAAADDICEWLTATGFRKVRNNTKLHADELQLSPQKTTQWFRQNLDEAALFSNTKLVIIATDAELLKPLWQKKGEWTAGDILARKSGGYRVDSPLPKTIWNRQINHWTLVSRLSIDGQIVRIKLYTWGNSLQGTFDLGPFLSYYGGHIVADPPEMEI